MAITVKAITVNMMMDITTSPGKVPRRAVTTHSSIKRLALPMGLLALTVGLRGLHAQAPNPASASTQSTQETSTFSPVAQNIPIGAGDLLDVTVFNTPELSTRLRVDQQGRVTLPLGGDVEVRGLKVAEAAVAIQQILVSKQIMLQPTVMVNIVEYSTAGVTVLGEVRTPGIYTILGPHSLYDALASAGGALPSEGSSISITHASDANHPLVVPVTTPNYSAVQKATIVQPGDTIVVSRADLVYIVGDMTRSGAFYVQNGQPLTILDLVSLAQGPNRTASMSRTAIIRNDPDGSVQSIRFNLDKVMKNQEKNLVLQAGDILVVPRSGWKTFGYTALPGVTNAAASAIAIALVN
jgi:polysaccharide biosynthesis/export protein